MDPEARRQARQLGGILIAAWAIPLCLIWAESSFHLDRWVADVPVLGISLCVIAVSTFIGVFQLRGNARAAIASSLLMFYLAFLTFLPAAVRFRQAAIDYGGENFVSSLTTQIAGVLTIYFVTEALLQGLRLWKAAELLAGGEHPSEIHSVLELADDSANQRSADTRGQPLPIEVKPGHAS